jgi:hypothetical protein
MFGDSLEDVNGLFAVGVDTAVLVLIEGYMSSLYTPTSPPYP